MRARAHFHTRALMSAVALSLVVLPLTACAPEPGTVHPDGTPLTEKHEPEEIQREEAAPEEALQKQQALPEGFPAAFALPEGAQIDDAGERSTGAWYLVLKAADQAAADALWEEVIAQNGFTVSEDNSTPDGRAATLSTSGLTIEALTLPAEAQGSTEVLLSYDIAADLG